MESEKYKYITIEEAEEEVASISPETLASVKNRLGKLIKLADIFGSLRDSIDAKGWTSKYLEELRKSNPDPKFLSLVEKFDISRKAQANAIRGVNTEGEILYKSLAYKAHADCYSEAGINEKAEEMIQKYEEEKENYINEPSPKVA